MKPGFMILLAGLLLLPAPVSLPAGDTPVKNASDFSSIEYFDPPFELQISSRLSGAEAVPQSGGLVFIKQMKLETFATNGSLQYIVEAPQCAYDQVKGSASSPGHLKVRSADGRVTLEGEGFLWQDEAMFLTISNQQHTVIVNDARFKAIP